MFILHRLILDSLDALQIGCCNQYFELQQEIRDQKDARCSCSDTSSKRCSVLWWMVSCNRSCWRGDLAFDSLQIHILALINELPCISLYLPFSVILVFIFCFFIFPFSDISGNFNDEERCCTKFSTWKASTWTRSMVSGTVILHYFKVFLIYLRSKSYFHLQTVG